MGLKITPNFAMAEVRKRIEAKIEKIEGGAVRRFQDVGEDFVTNARQNHEYIDQTGNLTSSIGYVILKNGELLEENFEGENSVGVKKGKEVALDVATEFQNGLALICVAGMEYAAAVESKNYDVITISSIYAGSELKQSMSRLKDKVQKLA